MLALSGLIAISTPFPFAFGVEYDIACPSILMLFWT